MENINGIIVINKPKGLTSQEVVTKVKKILKIKKVGHTGTLDPNATGVLPLLLNDGTKISKYLIEHDKEYCVTLKLGIATTTYDKEGEITEEKSVNWKQINKNLEDTLKSFKGKQEQVPPIYSAIKIKGRKLYEYARNGQTVEIPSRKIEIYEIKLNKINEEENTVEFTVSCSKGTYIRSLIRDMGEKLGVGAVMSGLLRDDVNGIKAENAYKISDLIALKEEGRLEEAVIPMDELLRSVPAVSVNESGAKYLSNGNRLRRENLSNIPENTGSSDKSYINTGSADDKSEIYTVIENARFFRVYSEGELKALYTYDKTKKDFKVYKML